MTLRRNVPLKSYTTFHIGGEAAYFTDVRSRSELGEAVSFAKKEKLPLFVLGGGSNILVSDSGFPGLVVRMSFSGISFEERDGSVEAIAAAGESWDDFVSESVKRNLWGLENLSGIPGTVGATPIQNVGAYGVEVKDVLSSVELFDTETLDVRNMGNQECFFGYRDSFFKREEGKRYIVTAVSFCLSKTPAPILSYRDLMNRFSGTTPVLSEIRDAVLSIRSKKFPDLSRFGTAGSFFKNPILPYGAYEKLKHRFPDMPAFSTDGGVKISLAYLLDALSLKGEREGDVGTFERQPLVIVNFADASAADVDAFAKKIEAIVKDSTGIVLEREVRSLP